MPVAPAKRLYLAVPRDYPCGDALALVLTFASETAVPCVTAGRAVYAIGDIHGRLDLMSQLLEQITKDAARHPGDLERKLVFLGDYVDRGPGESRGVVEVLRSRPLPGSPASSFSAITKKPCSISLTGGATGWAGCPMAAWRPWYPTAFRFTPCPSTGRRVAELREALQAAVPAEHVDFMRNCTLSHCEDDYVFVHAGVRPGRPLAMQQRNDLLWIREDFLRATSPLPGKVVVHGHTICDVPAGSRLPHRHRHRGFCQRPADLSDPAQPVTALSRDRRPHEQHRSGA